MAVSKNNPNARKSNSGVSIRVCEICGKEGELGKEVERVRRKKAFVWKCRDKHYD